MSTSIDQAFAEMFDAEVHEAYQRKGSKLRNCVRTKTVTKGNRVTFQRVGRGSVGTKTRHGMVPLSNIEHTKVTATLVDYYSADYIDTLDELKTNIDERGVAVNAGAYALGRKSDDLILEALAGITATIDIGVANAATFRNGVLGAVEHLNAGDVPADDQRWGAVCPKFWSWLMCVPEFVDADFIGSDDLPFSNPRFIEGRRWAGVNWMMHTGVTVDAGVSNNVLFHKRAVGHAIGADVTTALDYVAEKAAWFANSMMSQASVLIDPAGGIRMLLPDDVELPTS